MPRDFNATMAAFGKWNGFMIKALWQSARDIFYNSEFVSHAPHEFSSRVHRNRIVPHGEPGPNELAECKLMLSLSILKQEYRPQTEMTGGNVRRCGRCNVHICNDLNSTIVVKMFKDNISFCHKNNL